MWNQSLIADEFAASSSNYANQHRNGLEVFSSQQLLQHQSYIKGFYFHSVNKTSLALKYYSESLRVADTESVNFIRLQALENIELIIRENCKDVGRKDKLSHRSSENTGRNPSKWRKRTTIYKYLSHHYITKRSVIFIVDPAFSK